MSEIVLKKGASIGEPAAEDDDLYLFENFVENHSYSVAMDVDSPKFILVGRTGAGKTAIIRRVERDAKNVVKVCPADLSLRYLSNSNIIQYLRGIGVKMDVFYQLLWRHVIATELIKAKFGLKDDGSTKNFLNTMIGAISQRRKKAIEYLSSFSEEFWLDVDARVTQVTQSLEADLKAEAGITSELLDAEFGGSTKEKKETKTTYKRRAQKVIDDIKMQELGEVINWLDEDVFKDDNDCWHLVIDELDEDFASGDVRYELIKALIDTVKKYKRVRNLKIIVAVRSDLLEETFSKTTDPGFQPEKFEGNINEISWGREQLAELLDKRLNMLFSKKYESRQDVGFYDLFGEKVGNKRTHEYLFDRTLMRPRDAIVFVNECLKASEGKKKIGASEVRKAEQSYSARRFNALQAEWAIMHSQLPIYVKLLMGQKSRFKLSEVSNGLLSEVQYELLGAEGSENDIVAKSAEKAGDIVDLEKNEFVFDIFDSLFKIGILDAVVNNRKVSSVDGRQHLNRADLSLGTDFIIHPMLYQYLNVRSAGKRA